MKKFTGIVSALVLVFGFLVTTSSVSAATVSYAPGCTAATKYSITTGKLCGVVLGETISKTTSTGCVPSATVKCATISTTSTTSPSDTPTRSLTVTTPIGGEIYQTGQQITINWNSTGYGSNSTLAIDLVTVSPDTTHTNTFLMSVSNLANDGTETLTIPSSVPAATNYGIHMSIYDPVTTLWQDSFSNGMFTIQPPIVTGTCTINSFTASPSVVVWNTPTTLYWNTNCANITILGIYPYTGQNLGPSGTISSGSLTANTNFTLYGSNNPGCLGTVYSTTTGQPCSYVTSNTAATVTPQNQSITLVSPNGGEIWQPGTPLVVRWNSANIPASTLLEVNIYSINGPIAFGFLAPNGTPNDGVESFSTANLPNGYYKVIVGVPSAGLNNSALSTSDESDAPFMIQSTPVTSCSINFFTATPSTINVGGSSTLKWATQGCNNIVFNGSSVPRNGTAVVSPTQTTTYTVYAGTFPKGCSSFTGYSSTTGQPCVNGAIMKSVNVTVNGTQTPSVTILSPNGGEVYQVGQTVTIQWTAVGISSNAPIQIGIRDSRFSSQITAGEFMVVNTTNATQSYSFTIPSVMGQLSFNHLGGKVYSVVIYANGGLPTGAFDQSDSTFTISVPNLPGGCVSDFGYSATTGIPCTTPITWVPGCTSANGYSPTNGQSCYFTTIVSTPGLPIGCSSTTGYSVTTGQPCTGSSGSCPATTMDTPSYSHTTGSNGDITSATYSIPLNITACNNTVYLGQAAQYGSTTTASRSVSFVFNNSFAPLVDDVVSSAAWTLTSSDALIEGNAFRLDAGTTKHFTLTVTLLSPSIPNSSYRVHLKQLKSFTNAALTIQNSLLDLTQYKTDYQLINN